MKVYIWKYKAALNNQGGNVFANYFMWYNNQAPTLVDKIATVAILKDGVPIYNERLEMRDSLMEFTAGDFDVKLSLLTSDVSKNGDSLKDFLLPAGDRNFFYICIFEFGDLADPLCKRIGGRINMQSITADLTVTQNKYEISFTVTGILKEIADILQITMLRSIGTDYTLEMFISGCLKPIPQPPYLAVSTTINWDDRIGYTPILIHRLYNNIIGDPAPNADGGISKWSALMDLSNGLGFVFRADVIYTGDLSAVDYPCFGVTTFFRNSGSLKTIQTITDVLKYSDFNADKKYFVVTYRDNVWNDSKQHSGMLADNSGNVYVGDGIINPLFEEMIFMPNGYGLIGDQSIQIIETIVNNENPPVVGTPSATIINLPTYPTKFSFNSENVTTNLFPAKVSFISLFCNHYTSVDFTSQHYIIMYGLKQLIQNTIGVEYKYFVSGIKTAIEQDIVFDADTQLKIYDKTTYNGTEYFCKSISNVDIMKQTAQTEWVEA